MLRFEGIDRAADDDALRVLLGRNVLPPGSWRGHVVTAKRLSNSPWKC